MLKIKDGSGKLVATLKDQDSEPELTEAAKEKAKKKEEEKVEETKEEGDQ